MRKYEFVWWKTKDARKKKTMSIVGNSEHDALEKFAEKSIGFVFTGDEKQSIEAMENALAGDDIDFTWSAK